MQFKVPQFIDIESKIIGSLTFKQVIYIGGAGGMAYVLLKALPIFLAIPLIVIVGSFGWALAFYPKQKLGKPFIEVTEAAFKYFIKGRLYIWKRGKRKEKIVEEEIKKEPTLSIPKVSTGKLREVSKELEVGGNR